jgi:hypothetical protein
MPTGLAPGVHVAPPPPAPRDMLATDTAGLVGIAARGPVGTAVTLTGWPQFVATFGDFLPNAFLAYAVRGFFDNGGRRCVVVRAVAPAVTCKTVGAQPADGSASIVDTAAGIVPGALVTLTQETTIATTGVQPADRLSSLVADAHGFAGGAPVLATQPGVSAVAIVRAVDLATGTIFWAAALPAAFNLATPLVLSTRFTDNRLVASVAGTTLGWDRRLEGRLEPALPLSLAAGAGTAAGIIPDENGAALLGIAASSPGQWGNRLSVAIGWALVCETTSRRRNGTDAPDLLGIEALTGLGIGSFVELLQDGVPTARRRIIGIDRVAGQVRLDTPLVGFNLTDSASGLHPIRLRRRAFTLSVHENGRLVETFADLDLPLPPTPDDSPVNSRSRLIRIYLIPSIGSGWPDPASGLLDAGRCNLVGGRDGIAMLRPADLLGRPDDASRLGLRRFELAGEASAIAIPDAVIPPLPALTRDPVLPPSPDPCALCPGPAVPPMPLPTPLRIEAAPSFAPDDVRAIQAGLVEHCEARGDRVAVIDPPLAPGPDRFAIDALLRWRQGFDSSYATAYFPWSTVVDPIAVLPARTRDVPASGHALGQFALADAAPGYPSPANRLLGWTASLPRVLGDTEHAILNDAGVNVLRLVPGRGPRIMGARTLSSDFDWTFLTVRRLVIRLKRHLARALDWAVFEPNDQGLADTVIAITEGFLEDEWIAQRLRGRTPAEAFYVTPMTTQDDFDNGRFVLEIGIAPSLPAEFIFLRLSRNDDRLEIAETNAGGWPQ